MTESSVLLDKEKMDEIKEVKKHYDVFLRFREVEKNGGTILVDVEQIVTDTEAPLSEIKNLLKDLESNKRRRERGNSEKNRVIARGL